MVTAVILPAIRSGDLGLDRLRIFQAVEHRFIWIARAAVIVTGITGLYMVAESDMWARFHSAEFWWMHAMVCLWLLFAVILFVAEPLILKRWFRTWAAADPKRAFAWIHRGHWVLFTLSLVTICGAVAGSQGWSIF